MASNWTTRFMTMAELVATFSREETKVGCVLVSPDRRQVSFGYNGRPRGQDDAAVVIHAELNALLNARVDVAGWSLYTTKWPCAECAAAIVQKGLAEVISHEPDRLSRWSPSQTEAMNILHRGGVGHFVYTEKDRERNI